MPEILLPYCKAINIARMACMVNIVNIFINHNVHFNEIFPFFQADIVFA